MYDNVLIFGAGTSFDAGIPLLRNFVEKMLEIHLKGKVGDVVISDKDKQIFADAFEVRNELDGYHGRVAFDDRNIEDILSILEYNIMGGGTADETKRDKVVNAITRTIELVCTIKHSGALDTIEGDTDNNRYCMFWRTMFKYAYQENQQLTIITFNYDLALERALFLLLVNVVYSKDFKFPFEGIQINYYHSVLKSFLYSIKYMNYPHLPDGPKEGTVLEICSKEQVNDFIPIDFLKLHGSLNFPSGKPKEVSRPIPTDVVDNPQVLPPIFNKFSRNHNRKMWKVALQRLREAKNIIIVGYSLPRTDINMQYFLKAAVGPNINLNKIYIFNPDLYRDDATATDMKNRYSECFSSQLRERIVFYPPVPSDFYSLIDRGTFKHFVDILWQDYKHIFF